MKDQNTVVIKNEDLLTFVSGLPGGTLRYCVKDEPFLDYVSDGMLDILGCTREEFTEHYNSGASFLFQELNYSRTVGTFPHSLEDSMYIGDKEHRIHTYNGEEKWVKSRMLRIENPIGENWIYIQVEDIQKEKQKELVTIEEQQLDLVTRLLNKISLCQQIDEFLLGEGKGRIHAFLVISLENFQKIKHRFGSLFGDCVLSNISQSLKELLFQNHIFGRVSENVFVVLLKKVDSLFVLQQRIMEIKEIFERAYVGDGQQIPCSISMSRYPEDGINYLDLFRNANGELTEDRTTKEHLLGENNHIHEVSCYSKELSYWDFELSGNKMVTFAYQLLDQTRDVSSAMKALMERIGLSYGVSAAGIIEIDSQVQMISNSYSWTRDKQVEPVISFGNWSILEQYVEQNSSSGVLSIPNWSKLSGKIKDVFYDAKGVLLSGFYEDGLLKGYILLKDRERIRVWSKEEIQGFLSLSRIMSFYLLKIRVKRTVEKELEYIKNYDGLTGLPSRGRFREIATDIIEKHPQKQYAIVYSDISNFRYINDFFGYEEGDRILCDYGRFLTAPGLSDVAVSRISSDNFVALVPFHEEKEFANRVISINEEFCRQQKERLPNINLGIISGVCVIPDYQKDIMVAVDNANIARKSVKGSSKSVCQFFDEPMQRNIIKKLDITNSMEEALGNQEFIIYLQPKILLGDNSIVGAEALVRWQRKSGLMLPPDDFIPLFENNGFIVNLDFYVYEEVCKMLKKWIDQDMTVVPVSVNVSRLHLNDESFVSKIKALAEKYNLPSGLLELELTETIFLNNTEVAIAMMKELREAGFRVSIDDFGAGYSSLSLLKDMTTDVLKLDKEFFGQGEMQKEEQIIVSSIISMAKQLNMKVISEGVETEIQSDFLKNIFCDMAQGYLFAKPMPVMEFEQLLKGDPVHLKTDHV